MSDKPVKNIFANRIISWCNIYCKVLSDMLNEDEKKFLISLTSLILNDRERIIKDLEEKTKGIKEGKIITFTFLKDNKEFYLGDIGLFKKLLRYQKEEKYRSCTGIGACSLCSKQTRVFGDTGILKFYSRDKYGFVAGGALPKFAFKDFPLCFECLQKVREGKSFRDKELDFSFYGHRYYLIPKVAILNKELLEKNLRLIFHSRIISLVNIMSNEFERIRGVIEREITFDNVNIEFKQGKKNLPKISIQRLSFKNPILKASLQSSILSNVSKQIPTQKIEELHSLWKKKGKSKETKEKFEEEFREAVIETVYNSLKDKLNSEDMPTSIFPTSVASDEIPNYYISKPKESYNLTTKIELLAKLIDSICGRCGQRIYGIYIPEEGFEIKEILKSHVSDFYNVNIGSIAGVGTINLREIGVFEYLFYLLDRALQEIYRRDLVPTYHVELFTVEGMGRGKKFFSHYIIPNLNEVFNKLYHGDDKYTPYGVSKIKSLISSFLVENWNIDNNLKENNSERAHTQINRLLYYIFYHRGLDMNSILFLEDLKIKLGDTTPIRYLEEVISWM